MDLNTTDGWTQLRWNRFTYEGSLQIRVGGLVPLLNNLMVRAPYYCTNFLKTLTLKAEVSEIKSLPD